MLLLISEGEQNGQGRPKQKSEGEHKSTDSPRKTSTEPETITAAKIIGVLAFSTTTMMKTMVAGKPRTTS